MNIAVFGATGLTGKALITQALDRGVNVACLVRRDPDLTHPQLTVVQGSLTNAADVERVVQGSDAVVSVLGSAPRLFHTNTAVYSTGAAALVAALRAVGTRRLLHCTSAGVEDDPQKLLLYRYLLKPLLLKESCADMRQAERVISASGLDWVLVRPARLVDGPRTEHFRVSPRFRPAGGWVISRPELAYFLLEQVSERRWLGQTPTITY